MPTNQESEFSKENLKDLLKSFQKEESIDINIDKEMEDITAKKSTNSIPDTGDLDAPKRQLTFGEKAVGLTFNPGKNEKVESIKRRFADLIDELEGYRNPQNAERHSEIARMLSVAITECQSAQMWAVKAVTWQY